MRTIWIALIVFVVFFALGRLAQTIYDAGHQVPETVETPREYRNEYVATPEQQEFERTHEIK